MAIIFYDIPCTLPNTSWSPNTLKTRYTLNFKGIPYETVWVEYPDIEPLCKKLGIPPTSKKEDGNDRYTLPAIHDPSTGAYLSDSILIAEYLERTYPDTPKVFPHHTIALQATFTETFWDSISVARDFIIPAAYTRLNPRSQEYFRRTKSFGKSIEDRTPKGEDAIAEWAQFRDGLGRVDKWYAKSDGKGAFLMGETPSWGDIVVATLFFWLRKVWGEDSPQWKDISSWNDGRWVAIVEALKDYDHESSCSKE